MNEYLFQNRWEIDADSSRVFDALVELRSYPLWWADVRSVREVDEDTAEVVCRSVLPYALVLLLRRAVQDTRRGLLRVDMTGDLDGYCQAVVTPERPHRTRLEISQRVVVTKPLLRWLSPVARPLLTANHGMMMRRGREGLCRHLRAGASGPSMA